MNSIRQHPLAKRSKPFFLSLIIVVIGFSNTCLAAENKLFNIEKDAVRLIPFTALLGKITTLTGLSSSAPELGTLLSNRLSLGDYNYAQGIKPDNSITPLRLTLLAESFKPICQSAQMKTRYPDLGTTAAALIQAAYGRPATASDLAALTPLDATINVTSRWHINCMSVLLSAEFIAF